jgi:C-terminal processing protease CtpA/Prc
MWIGKNGDSWVVFDVVKYGPADRAGIKLGDQIEKIDG